MKKIVLIISLALFSLNLFAEDKDSLLDVTLQVGLDYRMSPTQLAVMYWLNPSNQLGIKAGVDREGEERQTSIALQSKHFLKNSFYISPEIFYLNTRENENWFTDHVFNLKSKFTEYVSMGAGVRIGNQWVINHFTIGIDWVGAGRRFGTFRKDNQNATETTYTLLNIYAGLSF